MKIECCCPLCSHLFSVETPPVTDLSAEVREALERMVPVVHDIIVQHIEAFYARPATWDKLTDMWRKQFIADCLAEFERQRTEGKK